MSLSGAFEKHRVARVLDAERVARTVFQPNRRPIFKRSVSLAGCNCSISCAES